ncbi:MAG: TadE/TadG family type IV pilus assembly protein [Pseudomonadota bacterium]
MRPEVLISARAFKRSVRRFWFDNHGGAVVEMGIILPVMLLLFVAGLVAQDSVRMAYLNNKAVYTVSDMVSREDELIDGGYFNGLHSVYRYLIDQRFPTGMRITTIECTANCTNEETRVLEVCWSQTTAGLAQLTTEDIEAYNAKTPLFAEGDTLLMTEAFLDYSPLIDNALMPTQTYEAIAFTRPRIIGQVKFDTGTVDGDGNQILRDCFNNT